MVGRGKNKDYACIKLIPEFLKSFNDCRIYISELREVTKNVISKEWQNSYNSEAL